MSSSSANGEQEQEMDRLRELNRQLQQKESETALLNTVLQQKIDDFELEKITRSPLTFSLNPALNLQASINSVAPLDETRVEQMIITSIMTSNTALETKIIELLDSKFSALTQHQQNTSRPISAATPLGATVSNGQPQLLQSPLIPNVFGGAPSTTNSFSPKPLNLAANIDLVATQGVNSHSPISTNPTYSHALEGTTSLFAGFHLIPIVGDYEAKQQQKQQKQQKQQQQQQQQHKWTNHIQRSYIKPDDRSAHLTDTHHKGKWPPPSSS